jgi:hypothetical protein
MVADDGISDETIHALIAVERQISEIANRDLQYHARVMIGLRLIALRLNLCQQRGNLFG